MIDISGHLRDIKRDIGFIDDNSKLMINCCGYQLFNDVDFYRDRPNGRLDYQIIYLYKGEADFLLDNSMMRLKAGNIILYRPKQVQYYKYFANLNSQAYWIHFTGTDVERILEDYHINLSHFRVGDHVGLCNIFKNIMIELQLKNLNYLSIIEHYFYILLQTIQRLRLERAANADYGSKIDNLILELNLTFSQKWTVLKMADFCNMSESRFLHVFKERKKISAKKFLLNIRINKAKDLMLNSPLNISQVAALTGFDDALYFSRVFKKEVGMSPRQYTKIKG